MTELHSNTITAVNTITQRGVALPGAQRDIEVPSDYSMIPNMGEGNIGDLMGQVAAYVQFLEYQVGLAEVEYDSWNNHYEFEKKRIMLTLENSRRDIMEAQAETRLTQLKNTVLQRYSELKLLKALLEGKRRLSDSLSRELSRRSLVLQMQRGGL